MKVATNVAQVKRVFPNARVGDSEVVGLSLESLNDIEKWVDAYREAVGEPLAFLHADVAWSHHAMKNLLQLATFLKSRHVQFGVIYNGGDVAGDESWAHETELHYDEIESGLCVQPDAAVFHTWVQYPTRVLPENQAGTLTNIVLEYLKPASSLSLRREGAALSGRLSVGAQQFVADAPIEIEAIDVGGTAGLVTKHYTGVVPNDAVSADIGLRINVEGSCACSGAVDVTIGAIRYREAEAPRVEDFTLGGPPAPRKFALNSPKQTVAINSRTFSVTSGAAYSVDVPISASWDSENAGYVAVIFLGHDGKQVNRDIWRFHSNEWMIGNVRTDASGSFHYQLPQELARGNTSFRASYMGNDHVRSAIGVLQ
jgi:hypothetical protein